MRSIAISLSVCMSARIYPKPRNSSSCPVLYDQTGSCVYSDLDKAELFNAHFHSVNVDDNGNLPKFSRRAEANIKLDTVQFTAEKIHKVIKRLKPKITRDPEGYSPFLVKQLVSAFADPLALLFSSFLSIGKIPSAWKRALTFSMRNFYLNSYYQQAGVLRRKSRRGRW